MAIALWLCVCVAYSILLVYMSVLCQYHTVFVTMVLYDNLEPGIVIPPALLFLLRFFGYLGSFVLP
jgi:hypothetical protein